MITINKPIRLIEHFAGYGSQAMAFRNIGADFQTWFISEFDKYVIKSYNAVHNTNYETKDIQNIHFDDLNIKETDKYCYIISYSFPCTDLSVAGKQKGMAKGSGTRSGLLWEVERILKEIVENNGELPQILFMENVKQIIGKNNKVHFDTWCEFLESLGYVNTYQVLNAKNYGVAQNRERCFMFSFLKSEFKDTNYEFPNPIPLTKVLKDYLEDNVDEKYYLKTDKAEMLIRKLLDEGKINLDVSEILV